MKRTYAAAIVCLLPVLSSCLTASGQEAGRDQGRHTMIKLYANLSLAITEAQGFGFLAETNKQYILQPSPAIAFSQSNGNFHEIELSGLTINHNVNYFTPDLGVKTTVISAGLRYEYNIAFFRGKGESRFKPYIGVAVLPYYSAFRVDPDGNFTFPQRRNIFGGMLSLVPRLNYYISKRCFIDLNVPVNIIDINRTVDKVNTPWGPGTTTTTINFSAFPRNFLVRLGVGVRI